MPLGQYGMGTWLIVLLKNTSENAQAAVRINNELGKWFNVRKRTRQGDLVLPYVFITHLERVMDANKDLKGGITVHGVCINNLRFADDIDVTEASSSSIQEAAQLLNKQGKQSGLVINKAKTQSMVFGNDNIDQPVKIDNYALKNVTRFMYLGSVFTYDDCSHDLWIRIGKATEVTKSHTHRQPFYGSVDFVRDNPGEPVPEETFNHSHSSWSSIIPI